MMLRVIIVCLLAAALAEAQDYTLCYDNGQDDVPNVCMNVEVDAGASTIRFHMEGSDDFDDVETLEDFNKGLAASRVPSQDACFIRGLHNSFEEQLAFLESHQTVALTQEDTGVELMAVPLDDNEEEMLGGVLREFCDDLTPYKLVRSEITEMEPARRQVSVTFRRCVIFFFRYICYTTVLTVPTGSTVSFGFFFFG